MSWDIGGYSWDEDLNQWDAVEYSKVTGLSAALMQLQSKALTSSVALQTTEEKTITAQKLLLKLQTKALAGDSALQQAFTKVAQANVLLSSLTTKFVALEGLLQKLQFLSTITDSALTVSEMVVRNQASGMNVTASPIRFHSNSSIVQDLNFAVKRGETSHEVGLGFETTSCDSFRLWFTENPSWVLDVTGFYSIQVSEHIPTTVDVSGITYNPISGLDELSPAEVNVGSYLYLVVSVEPDATLGRKDFAAMYIAYDEVA